MKPTPCCRNDCYRRGMKDEEHHQFVKGCVEEYFDLKREAKSNYMMEKIRSCIMKPEVNDKKARYNWTIGIAPNMVFHHVCPRAFQRIYSISHGSVENLCREIKKGTITNDLPFNDTASLATCSKNSVKLVDSLCETFNFKLNRNEKQVS